MHCYQDLITIFNHCFLASYNTQLVKGGDEPLYLPSDETRPYHTIYFAHGFFSSALHECSHWLIAGEARRQQTDFGYWYVPDGRTAEQQALFLSLEVKPQAMEWILSKATGYVFRVSTDNLDDVESDTTPFTRAVYQQVAHYCQQGLPARATQFRKALCQFYGTSNRLSIDDFNIEALASFASR